MGNVVSMAQFRQRKMDGTSSVKVFLEEPSGDIQAILARLAVKITEQNHILLTSNDVYKREKAAIEVYRLRQVAYAEVAKITKKGIHDV